MACCDDIMMVHTHTQRESRSRAGRCVVPQSKAEWCGGLSGVRSASVERHTAVGSVCCPLSLSLFTSEPVFCCCVFGHRRRVAQRSQSRPHGECAALLHDTNQAARTPAPPSEVVEGGGCAMMALLDAEPAPTQGTSGAGDLLHPGVQEAHILLSSTTHDTTSQPAEGAHIWRHVWLSSHTLR